MEAAAPSSAAVERVGHGRGPGHSLGAPLQKAFDASITPSRFGKCSNSLCVFLRLMREAAAASTGIYGVGTPARGRLPSKKKPPSPRLSPEVESRLHRVPKHRDARLSEAERRSPTKPKPAAASGRLSPEVEGRLTKVPPHRDTRLSEPERRGAGPVAELFAEASPAPAPIAEGVPKQPATLEEALQMEGLGAADRRLLAAEGITTLEHFALLEEEDFALVGIDIAARRQAQADAQAARSASAAEEAAAAAAREAAAIRQAEEMAAAHADRRAETVAACLSAAADAARLAADEADEKRRAAEATARRKHRAGNTAMLVAHLREEPTFAGLSEQARDAVEEGVASTTALALATLPELAELGLNMLERRTVANICRRCCNAAMTQAHERLRAELPAAGVELSTAGVRQLLHAGISSVDAVATAGSDDVAAIGLSDADSTAVAQLRLGAEVAREGLGLSREGIHALALGGCASLSDVRRMAFGAPSSANAGRGPELPQLSAEDTHVLQLLTTVFTSAEPYLDITSACGAVVTKGMSVKGAPQPLPGLPACLNEPHTRFVRSFVPIRDSGGDGPAASWPRDGGDEGAWAVLSAVGGGAAAVGGGSVAQGRPPPPEPLPPARFESSRGPADAGAGTGAGRWRRRWWLGGGGALEDGWGTDPHAARRRRGRR